MKTQAKVPKNLFSRQEKASNQSAVSDASGNRLRNEFEKSVEEKARIDFDETAEMFAGLITGDEHYHSRSSAFIRLR